ncbi:MAG: protein-glutamate O-methyltransferase CheR [Chloroflexi bacterium]|nr:protein-glutamate O-methyltransferase CheR [Chloroflexota bacterium]
MEQQVYSQVKRSIKTILDIDLEHYKDEQMKRRLDSWLVRSGTPSWTDYFQRVRADTIELARFRDYLTINVSSFFRDIERWQTLRAQVMPTLLAHRPRLRLFSAGCSIGLEPYSLAILLDEITPARRHYLLATDLDRGALGKARARGPYTVEDTQNITSAQRQAYFDPGGPPLFVTDSLAKRITFREQNLLEDDFEKDFDLIVCRNVVIYFTEAAKKILYKKFYDALRPGGVLFVGGTEIIPRSQEIGFRGFGVSFYQKA